MTFGLFKKKKKLLHVVVLVALTNKVLNHFTNSLHQELMTSLKTTASCEHYFCRIQSFLALFAAQHVIAGMQMTFCTKG